MACRSIRFSAERVEVVRGAATLRYGSQAIGGVVNTISNRVPMRLPEGTLGSEFVGSFGSGADSRDFAGQFNARPGAFALHADAYDRHSDDYDTPAGALSNSWLRGRGGALGGAWIGEDNRLGLGVARHESRYGIPGEDAFIDMEQTKLSLRSRWALAAGPWQQAHRGWRLGRLSSTARSRTVQRLPPSRTRNGMRVPKPWPAPWAFLSQSALGVQLQQRDFSALGEGAGVSGSHAHEKPRAVRIRGKPAWRSSCACSLARVWRTWISTARQFPTCPPRAVSRPSALRLVWCSRQPRTGAWELRCRRRHVHRRRPSCSRAARTKVRRPMKPAIPHCGQERANSAETESALARRAGACGRLHLDHGFQQLHLWCVDGPQL